MFLNLIFLKKKKKKQIIPNMKKFYSINIIYFDLFLSRTISFQYLYSNLKYNILYNL